MKNINYIILLLCSTFLISCQEEYSFPDVELQGNQLDFTVTQSENNENVLQLRSMESSAVSYWRYTDADDNEIGTSNQADLDITLPFGGTYKVYYTAYTKGGAVHADPVNVEISTNDDSYFSAPQWEMLTNGAEGKTWVLDMANPVGWAGLDFPYNEGGSDYWNWYPSVADSPKPIANKNWGEMTFNLDGGYNIEVVQTALNSNEQETSTGTFNYNIEGHTMRFNGGVELLYAGDFYPDVSNWTSYNVVEISENSLRLSVVRDQDRNNEGIAQIIFHYKPKQ